MQAAGCLWRDPIRLGSPNFAMGGVAALAERRSSYPRLSSEEQRVRWSYRGRGSPRTEGDEWTALKGYGGCEASAHAGGAGVAA
eukprot:263524-Hanusia_phi.AAC.1